MKVTYREDELGRVGLVINGQPAGWYDRKAQAHWAAMHWLRTEQFSINPLTYVPRSAYS